MLSSPPAPGNSALALFLDLDGTLVELGPDPAAVKADAALQRLLAAASRALSGALAVVSGRTVASLDQVLSPLVLPAAGIHGLEYRRLPGQAPQRADSSELPADIRGELDELASAHPGLLIEHKGESAAVHYRRAPELESLVNAKLEAAQERLGKAFSIQMGKMVSELKPSGASKGDAVKRFMQSQPFAGRLPVFVGDDATDEFGFDAVNAAGGWSIRVGDAVAPTRAAFQLSDVRAVHAWLTSIADSQPRHCA